MQQIIDDLNPDNRNVFLLIPVSTNITVGLLFKPDKYMRGGKL
jgi:hypothetical protein